MEKPNTKKPQHIDIKQDTCSKTQIKPNKNLKTEKRRRFDTKESTTDVLDAATRAINPPEHIRFSNKDYTFWDSIIAEFANIEWTNHNLEIAAFLARTMSDLEMEQVRMRNEGSVRKGKINPRKQVIEMHTKNILSIRRSLAIHSRGKNGELRDQSKKIKRDRDLQAMIDSIDCDLIATPKNSARN